MVEPSLFMTFFNVFDHSSSRLPRPLRGEAVPVAYGEGDGQERGGRPHLGPWDPGPVDRHGRSQRLWLPSGKHTKNDGKIHQFNG